MLLSGVVLLLVMLPFLFIRLFYAPWLDARMRMRAPRRCRTISVDTSSSPNTMPIARGLISRLQTYGMPYTVIEPKPAVAAQLASDGIWVITGEIDNADTYRAAGVDRARLLVVNCEDTVNTNSTLTAREVSADVPIAAVVGKRTMRSTSCS